MSAVCFTVAQAHEAATAAYQMAKASLNDGPVLIECKPATEPVGIRQRKFLHGVVLVQVSDQARILGHRYNVQTWKDLFKGILIPDDWQMQPVPVIENGKLIRWEEKPVKQEKSTEALGQRAYGEFIDKVIDYAALELGVVFNFTNEEQALRQPRKDK